MNFRIPPINGIGSTTPTRRDERPVAEPTDHHERARLIVDECCREGLDPVKALRAAAGVARELGRPEQAEAFEAEAARFQALPFDWSGGAPSPIPACVVCGQPATRTCERWDAHFVCGCPLCGTCRHAHEGDQAVAP